MRRFALILSLLIFLLGLCGYYIGARLLSGSALLAAHTSAVWFGIITFLGLVLLGPTLSRILPARYGGRFYILRWSISMMMAIFFAVLFYLAVTDLAFFAVGIFSQDLAGTLRFWSLHFVAVAAVGTIVVGSIQALAPKVYRVEIPLLGLPSEFDGFTIAQISDLHIGELIGHDYVRAVVEKTNQLKPDLIALTGDIVDGAAKLVAPIVADLAALRSSEGTFYVTGNHEYYWGVENALFAMRKSGARVLLNEHVRIHRGSNAIVFAGVTDISAGSSVPGHKSDPEKSVEGVSAGTVKILLAHQPVSFRRALKAGFHLQLSGHTHGGQFFPWSLIVRLFQRYNQGLIRHENLWIYVNRGTATWGPRLRFGIPPEITLLTLRART